MPIENWISVQESGDTRYVYKVNDYDEVIESNKSAKAFDIIYTEWFDKFGLTDNYKEYLKAQKRLYIKIADAYIKNDKSILNFAEIERKNIEAKFGNDVQVDYRELLVQLEWELKYQIDPKRMSVNTFFTHLKMVSDKNKVIAKEYKKWQRK